MDLGFKRLAFEGICVHVCSPEFIKAGDRGLGGRYERRVDAG